MSDNNTTTTKKTPRDVLAVRKDDDGKNRYFKVGVAFDNPDGSIGIILEALPLTHRLYVPVAKAKEEEQAA